MRVNILKDCVLCWDRPGLCCKVDSKDAGMCLKMRKKCCTLAMYVGPAQKIVQKENAIDVVR